MVKSINVNILKNMKLNKFFTVLSAGIAMTLLASCENQDITFPDYEGGVSVYFAYQYPVRTIVLGESETYPTTLDNQHKCIIYGTMGGAYKGKDLVVDIDVDNDLVKNLYFEDSSSVKAMPAEYYQLEGNQLKYGGSYMGGVTVQLTDAFFADTASLKKTYVIPIVMSKIAKGNADILSGTPLLDGDTPIRTNSTFWNVQPKDYTLYCIKYINPYDGSFLRRGIDQVTENGTTTTIVRHKENVEKDELCYTTTQSLNSITLPITTNVTENGNVFAKECNLLISVAEDGSCTITSATDGITASGSGKFVKDGEKKAWGNKDRDAFYLDYTIDFGSKQFQSKDTLVARSREVSRELYTPIYKK